MVQNGSESTKASPRYQPLRKHARHGDFSGVSSDGRTIVVWPDLIEEATALPDTNNDTDWWARLYDQFPEKYIHAILVYCAVCGDCPQLDNAENLGGGRSCSCTCHDTGVARPEPDTLISGM